MRNKKIRVYTVLYVSGISHTTHNTAVFLQIASLYIVRLGLVAILILNLTADGFNV
jgi:hypothetical protein